MKNLFILANKPYKRLIFIKFNCLSAFQVDFRGKFLISLLFRGKFGFFLIFIFVKNFILFDKLNTEGKKKHFVSSLILSSEFLKFFSKIMLIRLQSILFGISASFKIIGYHYRTEHYFSKKKPRGNVLILKLGFFYDILLLFPKNFKIFWKKRDFIIFGPNSKNFYAFCYFIRFTRNLFPYKVKGITFENEHFSVKIGKKVKYK